LPFATISGVATIMPGLLDRPYGRFELIAADKKCQQGDVAALVVTGR
jgi:hypothetical protein